MAWALRNPTAINLGPCESLSEALAPALALDARPDQRNHDSGKSCYNRILCCALNRAQQWNSAHHRRSADGKDTDSMAARQCV
jgi:hypothetical protein